MNIDNHNDNDFGYLQLIIGPMFSGKTSTLIQLYRNFKLTSKKICVINYAQDIRYDKTKMSSHDKEMINCNNLLYLSELKQEIINENDVFLINEGQFFNDLKEIVLKLVEKYNKIVYVCGLDSDFKRNPFEQIIKLIPYADEVIKKYSICVLCKNGNRALFSYRLTNENNIKVIGSDNYIPLCRKCYLSK
jgi:thymidine kinase